MSPEVDELDSGWEDEEEEEADDDIDSGWDAGVTGAPRATAAPATPRLTPEEHDARAARRKERLRAKAIEKAERRKARAGVAAAKQKKRAPRGAGARSQRAPARREERTVDEPRSESGDLPAPLDSRRVASSRRGRTSAGAALRVIVPMVGLLALGGGVAWFLLKH